MSRRLLALALSGAATAALLGGTATPAAAYCDPLYEWLGLGCTNNCYITTAVYEFATQQPAPWNCPD